MVRGLERVDYIQGPCRCRCLGNEGFPINVDLMLDQGRNKKGNSQTNQSEPRAAVVVIVVVVVVVPVVVPVEVIDEVCVVVAVVTVDVVSV